MPGATFPASYSFSPSEYLRKAPIATQPVDFLRLQLGKRLVVARSVDGIDQIGHAFALEVIKAGPF